MSGRGIVKRFGRTKLAIASVAMLAGIVWAASTAGRLGMLPSISVDVGARTLNDELLEAIATYPPGHVHPLEPMKTRDSTYGVTREIRYQGRAVAIPSEAKGIYCSGIVFDAYMKACALAAGDNFQLPKLSASNFSMFRKEFYGADGNERTMVDALSSRQLGAPIELPKDALPGDLIQFWRGSTGHSAVFIKWEADSKGMPTGVTYWSAQLPDGIGQKTEFFRGYGGDVDASRIYLVRAFEP